MRPLAVLALVADAAACASVLGVTDVPPLLGDASPDGGPSPSLDGTAADALLAEEPDTGATSRDGSQYTADAGMALGDAAATVPDEDSDTPESDAGSPSDTDAGGGGGGDDGTAPGDGSDSGNWEGGLDGSLEAEPETGANDAPAAWSAFDSGGPPTVANSFTPALGTNVITLAPYWVNSTFYLYVLTADQDYNGDYSPEGYSSTGGSAGSWHYYPGYYQGIVAYYTDEFFVVGWAAGGSLWKNNDSGSPTPLGTGVTSFANAGSATLGDPWGLFTTNLYSCGIQQPGGWCVYAEDSNILTASMRMLPPIGAEQVTVDTVSGVPYYLDINGNAWKTVGVTTMPCIGACTQTTQTTQMTTIQCAGGPIYFSQIAAKNGMVYGLANGHVYRTSGLCWSDIVPPDGVLFRSIATDNSTSPSETVTQVWASDQNGTIWFGQ